MRATDTAGGEAGSFWWWGSTDGDVGLCELETDDSLSPEGARLFGTADHHDGWTWLWDPEQGVILVSPDGETTVWCGDLLPLEEDARGVEIHDPFAVDPGILSPGLTGQQRTERMRHRVELMQDAVNVASQTVLLEVEVSVGPDVATPEEDEAYERYRSAKDAGLSDYEAREDGWPSAPLPDEDAVNAKSLGGPKGGGPPYEPPPPPPAKSTSAECASCDGSGLYCDDAGDVHLCGCGAG